jgi:hypothetical protein
MEPLVLPINARAIGEAAKIFHLPAPASGSPKRPQQGMAAAAADRFLFRDS